MAPRLHIPTGPQPSSLPSCPPLDRPYHPEFIWDRNDRPHADGGCVVQIARARRMVGKRRRKYLVSKERRGKRSRSQRISTMNGAKRNQEHASLSRDITDGKAARGTWCWSSRALGLRDLRLTLRLLSRSPEKLRDVQDVLPPEWQGCARSSHNCSDSTETG